jgi:hypothetical protein
LSYSVDWNRSRKRGDAAISRLSIVSKTCLSTHDCTCSEAANVNGSSDKGEEEAIYQNIISIVIPHQEILAIVELPCNLDQILQ